LTSIVVAPFPVPLSKAAEAAAAEAAAAAAEAAAEAQRKRSGVGGIWACGGEGSNEKQRSKTVENTLPRDFYHFLGEPNDRFLEQEILFECHHQKKSAAIFVTCVSPKIDCTVGGL